MADISVILIHILSKIHILDILVRHELELFIWLLK